MLHLLRSLQYLEMQGEARRLSFRALDIEQIGHVYEGLLDHTAKRATEPVLGLVGPRGNEPEIPLSKLEAARAKGDAELLKLLREETGKSETALQRLLDAELDTDESGRLRAACGNEAALFKRVLPFGALVRNDTFGRPVVIPKGSVYVTAGADRRSSGTHYTPRSLTEPIVQYTLEPLVYEGPAEGKPKEQWRLRSPRELLDLKICDMACGSGAFLVQACRYLSDRLVEAWEDIEKEQPGAPRITPEGAAATGALDEVLIPQETNERMSYAQRIVAQRCLYGVDKNPLAVEMAKLSLWLLTLAKYKPFTFIDHAIRSGDSLIGLHHLDQIKYFTLDLVNKQESYFSKEVQQVAAEVIELRKRIEARPVERVEDAEIKQRLLAEADAKTAQLGYAADLLLSVEFREINERQKEVWRRDMTLEAKMQLEQASLADFKAAAEKALNGQPTFHWPLEFPEVFALRGGFDAFIGNPPFMGGQLITGALGKKYRTYLINSIALGQTGSADLCSYFFLRISSLLKMNGSAGLIATNTISEGETRQVGLDQFSSYDTIIRAALATKHWPGAASIVVSLIWIIRGDWKGERLLNGSIVPAISSSLSHSSCTSANPLTLATQKKRAFKGSSLQGVGFLLSPDHALSIISQHPEYTKVLFPHLSGADVTSSPNAVPTRWAIKFFDWPLQKAEQFPICLDIVRAKVKPQREKAAGRNTIGARRAEFWWKYDAQARNLYDAIDGLPHVWVVAEHSKYAAIAKQPANISFNHTVVVFSTDSFEFFAAASSSIHLEWTRYYGGSLKTDISYSVADVFETFPFPTGVWPKPIEDPITLPYLTLLEMTGRSFYNKRQNIMIASNQGLTGVYNRFHNPEEPSDDIRRLRELHREMDETVAAAYGWTDLRLEHGFHETKQGMRFTISEGARREVLDRLLELNHKRYAEEVAAGLHEKGAKKAKQAKKGGRAKRAPNATPSLFGEEEEESELAPKRRALVETNGSDRPLPIEEIETNEVMAAFRQSVRDRGWMTREELVKEVSVALRYQRMSAKTEEALRNHLRAAVRRGIVAVDGRERVGSATRTMEDYSLEELREVFASVMRLGRRYEREEVIYAVGQYLGFRRISDTTRQTIKSAFNSAIRQGILRYEGDVIWRDL